MYEEKDFVTMFVYKKIGIYLPGKFCHKERKCHRILNIHGLVTTAYAQLLDYCMNSKDVYIAIRSFHPQNWQDLGTRKTWP